MMIITLIPDESELQLALKLGGEERFSNLSKSIMKATNLVGREWKKGVMSSNAKEGWKTIYAASIGTEKTNSPLSAAVTASGMFVNFVEDGVKRYDMKIGLLNSKYAKVGKNGKKYLRIFMKKKLRQLPPEIRRAAQSLDYGESLSSTTGIRSKLDSKYSHKKGTYQGLTKVNKEGQSQYGTFRIVTQDSKGWWNPGAPSYKIFDTLTSLEVPVIRELQNGLAKDLEIGFK